MAYFKVTMERGHQGTRQYDRTITFYYEDTSIINAMDRAKRQPGVKHGRMPLSCGQCSREEYYEMRKVSAYERAKCKK